jgi:diamine N-acetyltransferase
MIKDDTIRLRPLEPEDLEYLYKWENNMDLWEVSDTITPFSRFTLKKYIENAHLDIYTTRQLRLVIELIKESRPVGLVDLYDFDPYHQRAGIGILIHASEDRRLGYATSAIQLMISYAFETLGLNQVYSSVPSGNISSLDMFAKIGFTRTGYRKEWLRRGKEWEDVVYFQLLNK